MPRYTPLSRRDFLKTAAAGGLLLGLHLPLSARAQHLATANGAIGAADAPPPDFEPNAFIRIAGDGTIVFTVARSEMGQGVMTALPMLLAEELAVGLDQLSVRFAPADPVYTNELIGQQLTGGSTSIREAWTKLREAGALARTLLQTAAAARWGVATDDCRCERAQVFHPTGDERLGYGELASAAAALPLPTGVFLKEPDEWTLIGTSATRLDLRDKVTGRARFGLDVRPANRVVASIERCPVFGGKVHRFAADDAAKLPGVLRILEVSAGVAVVASDTWSAFQARKALQVEWDFGAATGVSSTSLREAFADALLAPGVMVREAGDAGTALAGATTMIEAIYEAPFQAHACMEPMNCTADVRADGCDIYVPTQAQTRAQDAAIELTGLARAQVRVHTTFLGGGFGRRGEVDVVRDAVELSQAMERPVQVVWTREDDIRHDFYRPLALNQLRGGLDADGAVLAWEHRIAAPSILARVAPAAVRDGNDPTSIEGAADLPYAIPNIAVDYRLMESPVPVGFWRSVGPSQNTWVTECFLDELAAAAGQNPLDLRRRLLQGHPRHLAVLELAAAKADWDTAPTNGRHRGIAVAESFGSIVAEVAEVSVNAGQVQVHRVVCAIDCGQVINPDTVVAQMEGSIVFALTATLKSAISIAGGRVEQGNFDDFPLLRLSETPSIDVHIVPSDAPPGGVGEPGVPPLAPAVCNAVFAATGKPVRSLPIRL